MSDEDHGTEMNAYRHGYYDGREDLKDGLRELVEQWQEQAEAEPNIGCRHVAADALGQCADELEERLDG